MRIFHLLTRADWAIALRGAFYAPPSLASDGFVHFSTEQQLLATAQRFFAGRDDLIALAVDADRLTGELRFELADGESFPHLFGPVQLGEVVAVAPVSRGADGRFQLPSTWSPHVPPGLTERFAGAYEGAPPKWDIGRAQPAFVRLEQRGQIVSPVIDVGCGTGENALYLAARGHTVTGIDLVPRAIEQARAKAAEREIGCEFAVGDALALGAIGRRFATAIDSGVFHVFDDAQRSVYVESLAAVLEPGGRYFMLVFSDREPTTWGGPRRITRREIELAFGSGWKIDAIEADRFETTFHDDGGQAWLAEIERRV